VHNDFDPRTKYYKERIKETVEKLPEEQVEYLRRSLHIDKNAPNKVDRFRDIDLNSVSSGMYKETKQVDEEVRSRISRQTDKSYVSKLERNLTSEKEARQKLEREVDELRRTNQEFSKRLGISH